MSTESAIISAIHEEMRGGDYLDERTLVGIALMIQRAEEHAKTEALKSAAALVRAAAQRIPLGGVISIRGSENISGFNVAEQVARIIENINCERDIYTYLCDEPERQVTP